MGHLIESVDQYVSSGLPTPPTATNARDWKPSRPNWTAPARDTQRLKRSRTWYQPVSHWKWFGCNALTIYESGWEGYHRKTYCHVINVNEVDEHDEKKT